MPDCCLNGQAEDMPGRVTNPCVPPLVTVTALTLPPGSWWSWAIWRYDGATLTLISGNDLTYHHELELSFSDVEFIEVPAQFERAAFREPTGTGTLPCLIAADAYSLRTGSFIHQLGVQQESTATQ
jgi:hypothetical protein